MLHLTRRAFGLGTAALAAGTVTACSSSSAGSDGSSVTWWATNMASTLQRDQEVLTPILDRFTEETGIDVVLEVHDWSDYYNKVLGAISSGEGPDVMSIGTTWTQTLGDTGAYLQLDENRMGAIGGADKFVAASLAAAGGDSEGGPTFVPLVSGVTALWWNPALFAEAGIDGPPTTWDEFVSTAKALTLDKDGDGTIDQWGFGFPLGYAVELSHIIFALGRQEGGEMFDADGSPTLDSDGLVAAAKRITDLMTVDEVLSPADVEKTNIAATLQDFVSGRVAMTFASGPTPTFDDAGFTDFEGAEIPVLDPLPGDPIMTHVAGVNIGIFAETRAEESALELVKYLTDPAAQTELYNAVDTLPANEEAYSSDAIERSPLLETYETILADHADTFPLNSKIGQAETLIGDAMKQLLAQAAQSGELTEDQVRQVLAEANTQLLAAG